MGLMQPLQAGEIQVSTNDKYEALLRIIRTFRFRGFQRPQIERQAKELELDIERFDEAWSQVLNEEEEAAKSAIEAQRQAELEEEEEERERVRQQAESRAELAQAYATPAGFGTSGPPEIKKVEL